MWRRQPSAARLKCPPSASRTSSRFPKAPRTARSSSCATRASPSSTAARAAIFTCTSPSRYPRASPASSARCWSNCATLCPSTTTPAKRVYSTKSKTTSCNVGQASWLASWPVPLTFPPDRLDRPGGLARGAVLPPFVFDALLVLGLLARRLGLDRLPGRHGPHPLARYRPHFLTGIKRLFLACQSASAPRCPASPARMAFAGTLPCPAPRLLAWPCPQDTRWRRSRIAAGRPPACARPGPTWGPPPSWRPAPRERTRAAPPPLPPTPFPYCRRRPPHSPAAADRRPASSAGVARRRQSGSGRRCWSWGPIRFYTEKPEKSHDKCHRRMIGARRARKEAAPHGIPRLEKL